MYDVCYDEMSSFDNYMETENELSDFILNEILESFNIDMFNVESSILTSIYNKEVVLESVTFDLMASVKRFYVGLISEIKRFMTDIQIGVERAGRERSYRARLDNMEKLIKDAKKMGRTHVIMANVNGMLNVYKRYYQELSAHAKKISKMRYKDTLALDKDLAEYQRIVDKYDKEFDKVSKEEVRISIDDGIRFVEHEKSGNSRVLDTLNDLITDVKLIQKDVEDIIAKEEKLGSEVIPKHVSAVGRITTDLFKSIRKMCGRIIGKIVFRFA